ncbi:MAG: ABC transporter permease, partial [Gemmatimonadota bacterium]
MRDWSRYIRERLSLPEMKGQRDERVIEELASQLEEFYLEALRRGASEQEAAAYAREQVTDWDGLAADILRSDRSDTVPRLERWVDRSEQRVRQKGKPGAMLADLEQDVRYSLRTLRRSPGFLAVSVLVLGLGIGATTAIFSVLKAVVLRPLPYPDPDRLVMVWQSNTEYPTTNPLSVPDYFDWREQNESLEEWGVFIVRKVNLSGDDLPERVQGAYCTVGLMKAIGIEPALGRLFTEQEEQPGNGRVVLISDDMWEERFAAEPSAIGGSIRINGESYTVVGIMPEAYEFPLPWYAWEEPDVWVPLALSRDEYRRDSHWLFGIGRLRENVSIERGEAELKAIAAGLAEEYPDTNSQVTARLVPLLEQMVGWVSDSLWILLGAVGFVLLIACANISSLLLARGANRQAEMAIRTSLGAGRERLVRQLITESLMLAALGGIAGVLLAAWSMGVLRGVIPSHIPRISGLQIDNSVLLFSLGVTLIAGMVFGLTPAFVTSGMSPMRALREGGRSQTLSRRQTRFLGALIVLQFGLALVLANGAVLMLKSLLNATGSPELFEPEKALIADISLQGPDYETVEQRTAFWDRFLERVEGLPGVEAVGVTTQLPLFGGSSGHILVD